MQCVWSVVFVSCVGMYSVCLCVVCVQFMECVGVCGWYGIRDMGIYVLCGDVRVMGIICMCLCVMWCVCVLARTHAESG